MTSFVHLNVHSEYSLLRSTIKTRDLVKRAIELNQEAVALTDYGNMFGVPELYREVKRTRRWMSEIIEYAGKNKLKEKEVERYRQKHEKPVVKPIIGCQFSITPARKKVSSTDANMQKCNQLVLIAKNNTGYSNLMKLCTAGHLNNRRDKPVITHRELETHAKGLICLTCNIQGELGYHIARGNNAAAQKRLEFYARIFGKGNVYLCLQDHGLKAEKILNRKFLELHKAFGYKLVAVSDVHYLKPEDSYAHDVLLCIKDEKRIKTQKRIRMPSDNYYMRSSEEMQDLFKDFPGAIENTVKIADACQVEFRYGNLHYPKFVTPKGYSADQYLACQVNEGLARRFKKIPNDVKARARYELEIIKKICVSEYLLIVQDYVNAAKASGIPVGPGRGSVCSSLVCYVLGITEINPLDHNLVFECFVNYEKFTMLDIILDFSDTEKHKVVGYLMRRYGKAHTVRAATFGRLGAKMVIRDVGRVLGFKPEALNRICRLFPSAEWFMSISGAMEESDKLRSAMTKIADRRHLLNTALQLENLKYIVGRKEPSVIVAKKPISEFAPLFRDSSYGEITSQYDGNDLEDMGLLKIEVLGFSPLSFIKRCVSRIKKECRINLDLNSLSLDDEKTLSLFSRGCTEDILLFDEKDTRGYLQKLPELDFNDLINLNALYRPGTVELVSEYIKRKGCNGGLQGWRPEIKEILKDTHGLLIYKDQILQIFNVMGGCSLSEGDFVRRYILKRKKEYVARSKSGFFAAARKKGYAEKEIKRAWRMLVAASSFAVNKSHFVAYTMISYQMAYLKAHFKAQFLREFDFQKW